LESLENYGIKPGYAINPRPHPYRDTLENSVRYQAEVYRRAGELARERRVRSVVDIGCGLATKLIDQVAPHCGQVTGVDLEDIVAICRQRHGVGRWIAGDVEDPALTIGGPYDLVICADVIEHVRDPDRVMGLIRAASHEGTVVVLSTPERDRRRGPDDMGPPGNWSHVREWNAAEFCAYLQSRGFLVGESSIVELCDGMMTCHLVVGGFRESRP
jgi:SAM-dependent methyltransferase